MKILYISPENTVGTLSTWKRFHESQNNSCEFITFYKTANGFDSGICLNLPLVSTHLLYRKIRTLYYNNKYGAGGEFSIKKGYPPTWVPTKYYEKLFFNFRDLVWEKIINIKLKDFDLFNFDIYHFEWGLDFYRNCSFIKKISALGKPIICTYHGQDLRTRGVIEPLNKLSDYNFTSELDLLSMHPKIEYMFLPIQVNKKQPIKKTGNKIRICHSPTNRFYKGSEKIISLCKKIESQYQNVEFVLIENINHTEAMNLKRDCDIIIDQINDLGGWGYGMSSVESMSLGLCCMTQMNEDCNQFFKGHPFININKDNLEGALIDLINNTEKIDLYKQRALMWAQEKHSIDRVGGQLYNVYREIINER
tara:strand:- start:1057 stop:2148 length:1092 start_codon:yes stop_codon:yes gene_type:complete